MVEWADKAMCYRWLHSKANAHFSALNAWYTIPVIIISTLTGTANFAQQRVPPAYQAMFVMVVGGCNLLAGIITTIQQFLKITQLNEGHRVSSIAWDKFHRNLKIELAKHPAERMEVEQMLKFGKEEFDRLIESSPPIPEFVVQMFHKQFGQRPEFLQIRKPEVCDILVPTDTVRHRVSAADAWMAAAAAAAAAATTTVSPEDEAAECIRRFVQHFQQIHLRIPLESEILDNLRSDRFDDTMLRQAFSALTTSTSTSTSASSAVAAATDTSQPPSLAFPLDV